MDLMQLTITSPVDNRWSCCYERLVCCYLHVVVVYSVEAGLGCVLIHCLLVVPAHRMLPW